MQTTAAKTKADRLLKNGIVIGRKLTDRDVTAIRVLIDLGYTEEELVNMFDVSRGTIYHIRHGLTWRWLDAATKRRKRAEAKSKVISMKKRR